MALRDDIKAFAAAEAVPVLAVPTPELPKWDGKIFVTRSSPREVARCWKGLDDEETLDERVRFVVDVACDECGSRIFQVDDIEWLSTCKLLTPMIERLYAAGLHFNGLTEENRNAWRKNSGGTGGGGLPSSCAEPSTPASVST